MAGNPGVTTGDVLPLPSPYRGVVPSTAMGSEQRHTLRPARGGRQLSCLAPGAGMGDRSVVIVRSRIVETQGGAR